MTAIIVDANTIRVHFTENAYEDYHFSVWMKYGKHRVYVSDKYKQLGYIDMATRQFVGKLSSRIAEKAVATYLEEN